MSYDLNLYVKEIDDSVISPWLEKLRDFGIIAEIHPEFTFNDQSGFLPFKVQIEALKTINNDFFITGFELNITDIKDDEIGELIDPDIHLPVNIKGSCKELFFSVRYLFRSVEKMDYYPDPLEFQIAWASAAILCELKNGLLINPQVGGGTFLSEQVRNIAKNEIHKLTSSLKPQEWSLNTFTGW